MLFAVVGALGTACQFFVLFLLVRFGNVEVVVASTVGAVIGAIVNFALNHQVTFVHASSVLRAAPRYLVLVAMSLIVNAILVLIFATLFRWNYFLAQILATTFVFLMNYGLSSRWVFKSSNA